MTRHHHAGRSMTRRGAAKLAAVAAVAAVAMAAPSLPAQAQQNYPTREIITICPFGPGTGADVLVRYFAAKLGEELGKTMIVENKPGAQGTLAMEAVARAKPDGYTITITPASSTMAAAVSLFNKLPFDPVKDFTPITTISSLSFSLVVDGKSKINSVAELTESLKAKASNGFYGASTNTGIIATELYKRQTGLKTERVNYKSLHDTLKDMAAGHVDFVFTDSSFVAGQMKEGRIKALAVTSPKRSTVLPDVPTMAEAGIAGVSLTAWWAAFAPAGTPQPVIDKLRAAFDKVLAMPETVAFLGKIANDPMPGTPEETRELMIKEVKAWGDYVDLAKIEKQ